jgi:hypothetical protein
MVRRRGGGGGFASRSSAPHPARGRGEEGADELGVELPMAACLTGLTSVGSFWTTNEVEGRGGSYCCHVVALPPPRSGHLGPTHTGESPMFGVGN